MPLIHVEYAEFKSVIEIPSGISLAGDFPKNNLNLCWHRPMQAQTNHFLTCSSLISGNEFEIWSKVRLLGSNELLDASQ
jgi:hypothetical protein